MKKTIVLLVFALILSGCSTYLTQTHNVSKTKKEYQKVLVLARSQNRIARSLFERDLAEFFASRGISATPSIDSGIDIPMEGQVSEAQAETIRQQLRDAGYDGAIVTNLVNTEEYKEVIPGSATTDYYPVYYGRFRRYVSYYPATTWEPDRLITGTRHVLESTLYDLREASGDNLQWVGRFVVEDPVKIEKATQKYAQELGKALMESSIKGGK
ncbi:membrane lipoprotein lipid attachment site-containing protein [Robiginitalea sediminis]|uniref:membrane lipoprotein lipid attachment site-containing protein n=1 Tax=Robiginitalea sediminis TaxID=1982593 RepID=UPI00117B8EF4|nr:membrane lipoprotein lipid attachment site-containing protein [Robiginitalea sediminis]